ncbi:MAG: hypothetical protein AYL28_005100 [Candidatus Bathyarchaeota archaeon B23]|nr:MAG: hypothetical protein AYL28_005100 [Candidatus Bathyarchaeota archaeon B23]
MARQILRGSRRVSLDLGLSKTWVELRGGAVLLPGGLKVSLGELRRIAEREEAVFIVDEAGVHMAAHADGHFHKLVPTEGAPTLEIDGIRMHRTRGVTPDLDAAMKLEAVGLRGGRVLDVCTGLGYTALEALRRGAELVISLEVNPVVLRMAELNPWSRGLFRDRRLNLILGDAYDVLPLLPEGFFDYAIHDPPRFALAGHLYSGEFYRRLLRVLRPGGRLFHYTGEPGSRRRRIDLRRGVMRRLGEAGFIDLRHHRDVMGVTCRRPK